MPEPFFHYGAWFLPGFPRSHENKSPCSRNALPLALLCLFNLAPLWFVRIIESWARLFCSVCAKKGINLRNEPIQKMSNPSIFPAKSIPKSLVKITECSLAKIVDQFRKKSNVNFWACGDFQEQVVQMTISPAFPFSQNRHNKS